MKRTAEIVLGIIGALGYALTAAIGGFLIWMQNNKGVMEEMMTDTGDPNMDVPIEDFEAMMDMMGAGGWLLLVSSIVAIILGIVAMVLLKGNKKPVIAGIILIAVAVIVAFITGGVGIVAGLFYLVAGIMCLVRKPKTPLEM